MAPISRVSAQALLSIPLHRFIGIELIDEENPSAGVQFTVGPNSVNNSDMLHGGVVDALLDVSSYLALMPGLAENENAVSHAISVSLLRGAHPGDVVKMTGTVLKHGRTVAFLRADATVEGKLIATAQVTKSIVTA